MEENIKQDLPKQRVSIRFYLRGDRPGVRKVCCDTGFLGDPVDPVFEDRDVFADFLCNYYTEREPDSCLIVEDRSQIVGYILGCRFPKKKSRFEKMQILKLLPVVLWRFIFRYKKHTREYLWWIATKGNRETPFTPDGMPHFHINLLPDYRNVSNTKLLIDRFLQYLSDAGEKAVYGQVVTFDKRRGERFFARYGFEVADKKEVTKFQKYTDEKIQLFTVIKNLEANSQLYGKDLWKEKAVQSP